MKYALLILLLSLFSSLGFAQISTKGNWNPLEKEAVIEELNAARKSFETFLDSAQIDVMIQCLADKIEDEFENLDEMDGNSEDVERMTYSCLDDMGLLNLDEVHQGQSQLGNWNESDINSAYEDLELTREQVKTMIDSADIDPLFDCVVLKLESNFSNFNVAAQNTEKVRRLTYECINQLGLLQADSESKKGHWSNKDLELLNKELRLLRADLENNYPKEKINDLFECIRTNFENTFENYAEINNRPEDYKSILNTCYKILD